MKRVRVRSLALAAGALGVVEGAALGEVHGAALRGYTHFCLLSVERDRL